MTAAALSFGCVCLWHGLDMAIIAWCIMNFMGISIEMLAHMFDKRYSHHYQVSCYASKRTVSLIVLILQPYVSESGESILRAAAAAPFFAIMIISNIYFLSNWELGCLFLKRIIFTLQRPFWATMLVMFTGCRVSMYFMDKSLLIASKENVL